MAAEKVAAVDYGGKFRKFRWWMSRGWGGLVSWGQIMAIKY